MWAEEYLSDMWQKEAIEQQRRRVELAYLSSQLLENKAVAQYFSDVEEKFFKHADDRDMGDETGRNRAYFCISMVRGLRRWIEYCASQKPDAEGQLEKLLKGR